MRKKRGQLGKARPHGALVAKSSKRKPPTMYLSETSEIFLPDPGARRSGSAFKWLVSTCLAAIVGVSAIGMAMYASMDIEDNGSVLNSLQKASIDGLRPVKKVTVVNDKLRVASRKSSRLTVTSYGLSTKYTIHDRVSQRRSNREFITIKPYNKIVASLSTARPKNIKLIPAFNPFKLYANTTPLLAADGGSQAHNTAKNVLIKVFELTPNVITDQDRQKLKLNEIQKIVAEAGEIYNQNELAIKPAIYQADDVDADKQIAGLPPRTTVIDKKADDDVIPEQREFRNVKIRRGDSLRRLIREVGAQSWQAAAIADAMSKVVPAKKVQVGQELRFILVPTPEDNGKVEPISVSLFSGKSHKVTVARTSGGGYKAHRKPIDLTVIEKAAIKLPQRSTIYTSMYHAALAQNIPKDKILKILRIHSYDVDFKRRVQSGDGFEVFFDEQRAADLSTGGTFGELLYTATTVSGETKRFYRFRTPDGNIDYYDSDGSSSKKFLMRKPVRGARFTSGFGYRIHPILKTRKMHTGTDWAARTGTPILAAGNGIVEAAGRKGGYGNYIRLRHANGYKTAYAHLHRFAKGLKKGLKVRQGQVIGYVGSTGRSSGPHLHYEVLVNNRHVNPMKISVPSGRKLKGRLLADFQKERERINDLMRRPAVKERVAKVEGQT